MKRKLTLAFSLIVISSGLCRAQTAAQTKAPRLLFLPKTTDLYIMSWNRAELQPVDTSMLEVVYALKYRRESKSGPYYDMLTVLQNGPKKRKYYGMKRELSDYIAIGVEREFMEVSAVPGLTVQHQYTEEELKIKEQAGEDWMNSEIWTDLVDGTTIERVHDYIDRNISIEYEEPTPKFAWHQAELRDTICGYPCFMATAKFRGRRWSVWYAPDIPISAGPWKFHGLPGLILRACDSSEDYIWECTSISQKAKPIVYYAVEPRRMDRKKVRAYLRRIHETPLLMLSENGNCLVHVAGKQMTEEDDWTVPYNPIELE